MAGLAKAYELGYDKVAVTIAIPAEAEKIRKQYPDAIIFGVHVTGLDREEAETLVSVSDFVTSCASATIHEAAGKRALVQAGTAIPTYAMTQVAKDIILEKVRCGKEQILVKTTKLPVISGNRPEPLI